MNPTDEQIVPDAEPVPEGTVPVPALTVGLEFLKVGVTAFGGGLSAHYYHAFVERRHWLNPNTFLEGMVLSQIMPGSNVTNMAAFFGMRMSGIWGGILGSMGMTIPGALFLMAISPFYFAYQDLPEVRRILVTIAGAAVGLLTSISIRAAITGKNNWVGWSIAITTFLAFGILQLPLWVVFLVIGSISVWLHRPATVR